MAAAQSNGHTTPAENDSQTSKVQPSDVGWQFVPQYYNFVNKQPHRLHCFYNKRSTFIHGEEGDDTEVALGQSEIHERIKAIDYDQCKVFIHSIDSQSSANGGIIILVIGEMSNRDQPWRKFTQTFFLAEQPNGYFVLNDIFRYLKEDVEDDDDEENQPIEQEAAVEVPPQAPDIDSSAAPVPIPAEVTPEPEPVEEAAAPAPEPEPAQEPAHPDPKAVPEEAVVASVPDKDVSPTEEAEAVEEPVTSTNPPIEEEEKVEKPASPVPTPPAPKAAPAANGPNGTANGAPAQAAAPVAPAAPPKPAAPKTWASLAASAASSNTKAWGSSTPQAAAPSPAAAPPAPKKTEPAAPVQPSFEGKHPYYQNAMRVNTPVCFVKLPNWSPDGSAGGETLDPEAVKKIASHYGEVKSVEIVKTKACAFIEYVKVESARKAIIGSLLPAQGGEGGLNVEGQGRFHFETRKDKDERSKKALGGRPEGGPQQQQQQPQQQQRRPQHQHQQQQQGERGPNPNRGRGRGRGGAMNGGPMNGGDRPSPKQ